MRNVDIKLKSMGGAFHLAFLMMLVGVLFFPAQSALAQADAEETPAQEEALAEEDEGVFQGEVVVVTARKREENLQEVPVAVSVIAGDQLEDVAASDISELQAYVPNLSIYQGRNQSTTLTAFMRGIGQSDPLWGVDPGVGLYINDVYIARAQGALLDVYDVERVEVMRGPQGTLYGKNTIGGAIKYVTKEMTDATEAKLSWNTGSFNTQEIRAGISGAIVPGKLRAKVAFAKLTRDGYGDNLYTGREVSNKDTTAYRAGLEWLPAENVSLTFDFDHAEDDAEPLGLTRLQPNYLCPVFLGVECNPLPDLFDTESGLAPINHAEGTGYAMTLNWDINDDWHFKSITAYRETDTENNIDFDTTPAPIVDSAPVYFDDQMTQEFQLVYDGSDRFDGVVGLYYFDGNAGGTVKATFVGSTFTTTDGEVGTESYAIYADGNVKLTDNLTLNLGLRPTRETKHGRAFNVLNTDGTYETILMVLADFDDEVTFNSWAPKIGLEYQFNPDVMGYVKANRGFKSGGYNVRAQSTFFPESAEPFDDEVMSVVEIGVKSVLANRRLVLNGAAFYGEYTDVQVSTFQSYDSTGDGINDAFFGNFLNAGDATVSGLELEYAYNSDSWFGLSGYVAYLDAEPDSFLDENNDGFVDTQVITNAPELTGAIRGNFDFPLAGGLITGSIGYNYRDESTLTNEGGPHPLDPTQPLEPLMQDSFGLLDAWISWLSPSAHWRLGLSAKNITDEEYLLTGYNIPQLGVVTGSYGMPQTFLATVEYRFFK
ncbi:MAG: TonB-dependent receptor [Acidobacteriota bacterium]